MSADRTVSGPEAAARRTIAAQGNVTVRSCWPVDPAVELRRLLVPDDATFGRMARAMAADDGWEWDDLSPGSQRDYRSLARAAHAALTAPDTTPQEGT